MGRQAEGEVVLHESQLPVWARAITREPSLFQRLSAACEACERECEDLFFQTGEAEECEATLASLDGGWALPSVSPPAAASTLLLWLRSLAEGVVFGPHYQSAERCGSDAEAFGLVLRLPVEHHIVFEQICLYLRRMVHVHAAVQTAHMMIKAASSLVEASSPGNDARR